MTQEWAKQKIKGSRHVQGFTIVELLVVIVIIAILTVVTIVVFSNMRERANFSKAQTDMQSIVKALALYKVDNDRYPISNDQDGCTYDWCGWDQATGDDFIVGLSPKYVSKIPQMPEANERADTYLYQSQNGSEYQLIRYKATGLPAIENDPATNPLRATTEGYTGLAWGYRSNPSMPWW